MNKEVKELWVAALRSGEYEQGQRSLRNNDNFCCLGVLCDVYRKATGQGVWKKEGHFGDSVFKLNGEKQDYYLLPEIYNWAGFGAYPNDKDLEDCQPQLQYKGRKQYVADLNDHEKLNFDQIAKMIEEQL